MSGEIRLPDAANPIQTVDNRRSGVFNWLQAGLFLKGGFNMNRLKAGFIALVAVGSLLAGCSAQLSQADRNLLNQALEASRNAGSSAQTAQAAATRAETAAQKAESAAQRAESAATRAVQAAGTAESAAAQAQQSADQAKKAFEMGLKK